MARTKAKNTKKKIPFERQRDTPGNRMCGAASMAMVLGSLKKKCSQEELWEEIKSPDGRGNNYGKSRKLCLSFLGRGLYSFLISATDPIQLLKLCEEHSVRVILGHRLSELSEEGHFTVFTGISDIMVFVNDPALFSSRGKGKRIKLDSFLKLMEGCDEVPKNLCIVATDLDLNLGECSICQTGIIKFAPCPNCGKEVSLQPTLISGCLNPNCSANIVETLFCPYCDSGFRP